MTYFSNLINSFSARISINTTQIADYCGLDRVTVYRFMKGKTLPRDKATVIQMAEILQLTENEKNTFIEAYDMAQLGPHVYWERYYIREFMKSFNGMPSMSPLFQVNADDVEDSDRDTLFVSERICTIKRIQKEISKECRKPKCKIELVMRPGIRTVMDILYSEGNKNNSLEVNHLMTIFPFWV